MLCVPHRPRAVAAALLLTSYLAGCAPMVPSAPVRLDISPSADGASQIVLQRAVEFRLSTGYSRTLPASSRWRRVGRLPQGEVYRPVDAVFALEGQQVHEAYLVIVGSTLRGFYLPAESAYSPLAAEIQLPLGAMP